jgi:hypothetical protein
VFNSLLPVVLIAILLVIVVIIVFTMVAWAMHG